MDKFVLFKYISKVNIRLNPFDSSSASLRYASPIWETFRGDADNDEVTATLSFADIERAVFKHAKILYNKENS